MNYIIHAKNANDASSSSFGCVFETLGLLAKNGKKVWQFCFCEVICEDPWYLWDWFLFMLPTQPDKLDDIWEALASNLNVPIPSEPNCHCHMTLFAVIRMGLDYRHCVLLENWFDFCNHICIVWAPPSPSPPFSLKHMVLIVNVSSSGDYQLLMTFCCCCCCCCFPYAPSGLLFKRLSMCSPVMP
jgi:hypothetical protein